MDLPKRFCGLSRRVFGWFCAISTIILIAIIVFLIVVLINKPSELKISVSEASLSQFTLENDNTLSYSLALAVTLRNPNRKSSVFFDQVQVTAQYEAKPFAVVNLTQATPFYQGHKNTTVLRTVLRGRKAAMGIGGLEAGLGVYIIDVKIVVNVKVQQSGALTRYFEPPEIGCDNLRVPLVSNGSDVTKASSVFRVTKCRNVFIFKSRDKKKNVDSDFRY